MTDKQIIIDVSKCTECGLRNCEGALIYWCHTYDDHCKDFDNCYYKQLKRKEQECEMLKKQLKEMNEVIRTETTRCNLVNILTTELDQLKAENTRNKRVLKSIKVCLETIKRVDGNSFDEALTNEFKFMLDKISEVEDV